MSVRERILTIRLMEKAKANPAHAEVLGIVVVNGPANPDPYRLDDEEADHY